MHPHYWGNWVLRVVDTFCVELKVISINTQCEPVFYVVKEFLVMVIGTQCPPVFNVEFSRDLDPVVSIIIGATSFNYRMSLKGPFV